VTAAKTAGVCLVLAGIALAGPSFRIGTKVTWHGGESWSDLYDSGGSPDARVIYERFSVGPAVEASYGPVLGVLTGRIDVVQLSFSTSGRGGTGFSLFPMVGMDLLAEPPTQWRVKPYAWVGIQTAGYTQTSSVYEFHPVAGRTGRQVQVDVKDRPVRRDADVRTRRALGRCPDLTRRCVDGGMVYGGRGRAGQRGHRRPLRAREVAPNHEHE
jgi:hypothetical protein